MAPRPRGRRPVGEHAADYRWWIISPSVLRAEAAEYGLAVRQAGPVDAGVFAISVENDNR